MDLRCPPITPKAYRPYGAVIAGGFPGPARSANMGTARVFERLADIRNLRPGKAKLNLCVFRCAPWRPRPIEIRLLERHEFSTQVFLPLGAAARYLAVVCLGGARPDLSALKAFEVRGPRGITYKPGVWHHPLIVLDRPADFACLIWEDESAGDCSVAPLAGAGVRALRIPKARA